MNDDYENTVLPTMKINFVSSFYRLLKLTTFELQQYDSWTCNG